MRLVGVVAEAAFAVGLVFAVVAVEILDVAVALERQDVRRDAIEKPAVMADITTAQPAKFSSASSRARIVFTSMSLVGSSSSNDVSTGFEHFRQMNAVAFAARKLADKFLLVGTRKVELRNVGSGIHFRFAEHDEVEPVSDLIKDGFLGVQAVTRLIDVAKLDRFADLERAGVRRFLSGDQAKQRRLTRTVRPDDADDAAFWQREFEIFEQDRVAVRLSKRREPR